MCRAWCALLLALTTVSGSPSGDACWDTAWRCQVVNDYRAGHDRPRWDQTAALQDSAGDWARHMAATGVLSHSHDPGVGEVVGFAPDFATLMTAWDQSPAHRAILLGGGDRVGVGCARDGDTQFCAVQVR